MKYTYNIYAYFIILIYITLLVPISLFLSIIFGRDRLDRPIKYSMKALFAILFIRINCVGKKHIDVNKSYVFMPNHTSYFDPWVLNVCIPNYVRGLETTRHFKWPVYGFYIRYFGNIPINPKSLSESLKSIRQAASYLKNGKSVIVFPEGTRTKDGNLGQFKRLPFLLAKESKKDIIPVGTAGLSTLLPYKSFLIKPCRITIRFGQKIPAEEIDDLNNDDLIQLVRTRIFELREKQA